MNPKAVSQVNMVWLGCVVTAVATLHHVVVHISYSFIYPIAAYPWTSALNSNLVHWLYLTDVKLPPDPKMLFSKSIRNSNLSFLRFLLTATRPIRFTSYNLALVFVKETCPGRKAHSSTPATLILHSRRYELIGARVGDTRGGREHVSDHAALPSNWIGGGKNDFRGPLRHALRLPSRVSLARARFFLRLLVPSACYAG